MENKPIKVIKPKESSFTIIPDLKIQPNVNKFGIIFRTPNAQDLLDMTYYSSHQGSQTRFLMSTCFLNFENTNVLKIEDENNNPLEFNTMDEFMDIAKDSMELTVIMSLISYEFHKKFNEIQIKAEQTEKKSELPTKSTKQAKRSSKSGKKTQSTDSEA